MMTYDHYLVLDLEATCCDRGTIRRVETEIIEIGAVMLAREGWKPVSEFVQFVRPFRHPRLTAFCTELTSITQQDVDGGEPLAVALERLREWADIYSPYLFCSWGDYDRKQIERECMLSGLAYPLAADHLNVKVEFSRAMGIPKRLGMAAAMKAAGLKLEGTHHRGIDDARNIARLLPLALGG